METRKIQEFRKISMPKRSNCHSFNEIGVVGIKLYMYFFQDL